MTIVSDMRMYWRFIFGLRQYLRQPLTLEQSQGIVKRRMDAREDNFLATLRRSIYENEKSPYLKLLSLAGCEYGDLEQMVRTDGIEPALHKLRDEGVFVSYEEFKGKS